MNSLRAAAGQLAHPFCGSSGRSGQVCFQPERIKQGKDRADRGRLAGARAACDRNHLMTAGKLDRLFLLIGKPDRELLLDAVDDPIIIRLIAVLLVRHLKKTVGDKSLVVIKLRQITGLDVNHLLTNQSLPLQQLVQPFLHKIHRNINHFRCDLDELAARDKRMPEMRIERKLKLDRCENALGTVSRKPVQQRKRVRFREGRSDLVLSENIGIILYKRKRLLSVGLIGSGCHRRADVRSRQKLDQAPQSDLLSKLRRHLLRLLQADAAHLAELLRTEFQYIQRVNAEALHQERRRCGTDAANRVPGKILINRLCRFRHGALHGFGLELHPVRLMMRPHAGDCDQLSRRCERNAAKHRHLPAVVGVEPQDRISVFFILIDDRRNAAAQFRHLIHFVHFVVSLSVQR